MGGVRVRATIAAVCIVGLALVIAGVGMVLIVRDRLVDEVRTAAHGRADDIATALEAGSAPGAIAEERADRDDDVLVQVLDRNGNVIAASPAVSGRAALTTAAPGTTREIRVTDRDGGRERYMAAVAGTDAGTGMRVVVARALDFAYDPVGVLARLLLIGTPLLLLIVGVSTWVLVGRALRPVDVIGAEVDEISASALHRRITMPATHDEIARLAGTMNRMLDRLDHSQRQQRQFVSDASHELRSPVASIRELVEVALAHPERTTTGELADHVLAEDLRMQRLVEDLLLLARADEATLTLQHRPVDLDDLVFVEARRLRDGSALRVDTSRVSAARVLGDGSALQRVVANLGENAARHARAQVAFSLGETDHAVLLAVDDDGNGIAPPDRGRVFERFVRLDDARARDDGGSGLGLAIVAEVVAAHGGAVRIVDGQLGGTRVEVQLAAAP